MRFIKYSVLVVLLCVLVLLGLYHFYKIGYERYYEGDYSRLNEILKGTEKHDVLFIGSSRTIYHVNPKVVDSVARLNTFNAGMAGATILESKMILEAYLDSHKPPSFAVLDLHRSSFSMDERPFWNPTLYYPFLDNPVVYNSLKPYEHVFLVKHLPFFRFIEADDVSKENSFVAYFDSTKKDTSHIYKGYVQYSSDTIALPFKRMFGVNTYPIQDKGLKVLEDIIDICKKNKIQLVFTFAPVYDPDTDPLNPNFFPTVERYAKAYNIPFWNYKYDTNFSDHRLFREELHLNKIGADLFSEDIARRLVSFIAQNAPKNGNADTSLHLVSY